MIALLLLAALQAPPAASTPALPEISQGEPLQKSALHNQREAATLYLKGAKLLAAEQTEPAWKLLKQAADLEPTNPTYTRAAELAKQSLISQWVVAAVKMAGHGDREGSMALLNKAHTLDPQNPIVNQHLSQVEAPLAAAATGNPVGLPSSSLAESQPIPGAVVPLHHGNAPQSFHLRSNQPQVIQQVFKAYGVTATVDDSVLNRPIRLDADDATFEQAMHLGYADSKFASGTVDYTAADAQSCQVIPSCASRVFSYTTPAGANSVAMNISGMAPPQSSEVTVNLGGQYTGQINEKMSWFGRADYRYESKQYTKFGNANPLGINYIGARNLVNLRAGLESGAWKWTVYINNATNNQTPDIGSNNVRLNDFFGQMFAYLTPPRMIGTTLSVKY